MDEVRWPVQWMTAEEAMERYPRIKASDMVRASDLPDKEAIARQMEVLGMPVEVHPDMPEDMVMVVPAQGAGKTAETEEALKREAERNAMRGRRGRGGYGWSFDWLVR